ncbi:MAG TPA: hypothetical protein GX405_11595 [Rhizobiales bacterium]|nr:hypothetical protein [Hyphomicrobiales bacterium]
MAGRLDRRTFLKIAFALALAAAVALAARAAFRFVYWRNHRDEEVAGWMPLGYVARSHGVPVGALRRALGLPEGVADRRPIEEIARARGMATAAFVAEVEEALAAVKAARERAGQ